MSRLTADERRRANELRTLTITRPADRTIAVEDLAERGERWGKNARLVALVGVGLGGALALVQLLQQLTLYGHGSLLDWLLPRL
jgi:chemotaxis response regulator CheB